MTVLFLNSSSDLYGSSRILIEVVKIYKNAGLTPVVVLSEPGPLQSYLDDLGIAVRIQNLGILRRKYVNPSGVINRIGKNITAYRFLDQLHTEFNFDLVYSNTLAVVVGAQWAKWNKLPHIWHIHEMLLGSSPLIRLLTKMLDNTTPSPIVVSEAVKNLWDKRLKKAIPEVIHNGLPYEVFLNQSEKSLQELSIPENSLVITMVGRINPGKGQLFFLNLAREISSTYPHCHFVLVGDPYPGYESIEIEMNKFILENGLENCVSNLGFRKDVASILKGSDIFVLPSSLPDSLPTVILEAMAAGCPVVATRSGGSSEMVIDGKTGYLISINDLDEGVNALIKLILDPELRETFGNSGRIRVMNEFSLDSFSENIENHLWQQLRKN
ncbi:glycosyltransferase involved in cell wall biosynthesis [Algoriphagus ratkowskyi]|uniref:Glycosyltransferase involved in cell wall biosynthesis n=1 Tax=Algoriphagus ratkowskyi TaxID=57028 RepID=A0A2W7T5N4_9BACT|nr:glycosyltransferase family 4 protein [Algoriphagus ratkowskyi]PZX58482.1 glycosyltransferase involved in cell wall biosynthesis [Algoriphagus ratkowskyi]